MSSFAHSFNASKMVLEFIPKGKEPGALIRKELIKEDLLSNILENCMSLGDGMIEKILSKKS